MKQRRRNAAEMARLRHQHKDVADLPVEEAAEKLGVPLHWVYRERRRDLPTDPDDVIPVTYATMPEFLELHLPGWTAEDLRRAISAYLTGPADK